MNGGPFKPHLSLGGDESEFIHWRRLGPRFGGDEVGALAPKNFFLLSPPKCEIWGNSLYS